MKNAFRARARFFVLKNRLLMRILCLIFMYVKRVFRLLWQLNSQIAPPPSGSSQSSSGRQAMLCDNISFFSPFLPLLLMFLFPLHSISNSLINPVPPYPYSVFMSSLISQVLSCSAFHMYLVLLSVPVRQLNK